LYSFTVLKLTRIKLVLSFSAAVSCSTLLIYTVAVVDS